MNGILQRKGNMWYAVVDIFDQNGERKQKWVSTKCKNKTDANKVLRKILNDMENDNYVEYSKVTFIKFMEDWLDTIVKKEVEYTTWESYKLLFDSHIKTYFTDSILIQQLKAEHLQKYVNYKSEYGKRGGKEGLSGNSLKKHKNLFKRCLDYAVEINVISKNPIYKVKFPRVEKFVGKFYSAEQMERLLNAVKGMPIEIPVFITAYYGLRRGEVLGLRWEDIDFNNKTMDIRNTRVRFNKVSLDKIPKTESSRRTLPLIDKVEKYLKKLKLKYNSNKEVLGDGFEDHGYICCWENGSLYDISYINHKFKEILEKNKLPHIRFHDLRHSTASFLLKQGFSLKEIQVWLGHSDIATTANIYAHVDMEMKKNVADKLNKFYNSIN